MVGERSAGGRLRLRSIVAALPRQFDSFLSSQGWTTQTDRISSYGWDPWVVMDCVKGTLDAQWRWSSLSRVEHLTRPDSSFESSKSRFPPCASFPLQRVTLQQVMRHSDGIQNPSAWGVLANWFVRPASLSLTVVHNSWHSRGTGKRGKRTGEGLRLHQPQKQYLVSVQRSFRGISNQ